MSHTPKKLPTLKKTPVSSRYLKQLIKANDQICFSALGQWEFTQALAPLASTRPKDFTTTVFANNPFSSNLYRKMGDLPKFASESEQIALKMGVIAGVEYCLAYLDDVQEFRQKLVPSAGDNIKNDKEEEQIRLKIASWSGKSPTAGYFQTLGYLRLLRNHYAHVNSDLHPALKSHVNSYGTPLNNFWNNGITDIHGIDFKNLPKVVLSPHFAFGIMNLLRIIIQHIDDMVSGTITLTDASRSALEAVFLKANNRQLSAERLAKKVKYRLESEWGIKVSLPNALIEVERLAGTSH